MIEKKVLEGMGIDVPDDASAFYTKDTSIVFLVPSIEEYGTRIVFEELEIEEELTQEQIESLKQANCFGISGGCAII